MLNSTNSTSFIKCSCDTIMNKLANPPVFLLQPPPIPPFPFQLIIENSTHQLDIKNSNDLDAFLASKFVRNISSDSSLSSFKTIGVNSRPKQGSISLSSTPYIQVISATKSPSSTNNLFYNTTNNSYMFYIIISIAILILFLLLFIVISFVFVYLTKTKLKKTSSTTTSRSTASSTTSSSNIDNKHANNKSNFILNTSNPATVSSLTFSSPPLTPFSTSPKSNSTHSYQESSPTNDLADCVNFKLNNNNCNHHTIAHTHHIQEFQLNQHRNQMQTLKIENGNVANLNSFKQHNDLIKSNKTKLKNLIDSTNSSSSSNNELIFNLNSSSVSSLSPNKLANESILTNNTSTTVLTNNSRNLVTNNLIKANLQANFQRQQTLMLSKQRQQLVQQQDLQQHYYESIGDVSQFYFDVDEHLNKANLNQQFTNKNQIVLNPVNLNNNNNNSINQMNVNTIKNNMSHYPITCCSCTLLRMNANVNSNLSNHDCLSSTTSNMINPNLISNQASNLNLNNSFNLINNSNSNNQSNKYYLKSLVV